MPKRIAKPIVTPIYAWTPERKANHATIAYFVRKAIIDKKWAETRDEAWLTGAGTESLRMLAERKTQSIHALARSSLNYARLRAHMGFAHGRCPTDRPAFDLWEGFKKKTRAQALALLDFKEAVTPTINSDRDVALKPDRIDVHAGEIYFGNRLVGHLLPTLSASFEYDVASLMRSADSEMMLISEHEDQIAEMQAELRVEVRDLEGDVNRLTHENETLLREIDDIKAVGGAQKRYDEMKLELAEKTEYAYRAEQAFRQARNEIEALKETIKRMQRVKRLENAEAKRVAVENPAATKRPKRPKLRVIKGGRHAA